MTSFSRRFVPFRVAIVLRVSASATAAEKARPQPAGTPADYNTIPAHLNFREIGPVAMGFREIPCPAM